MKAITRLCAFLLALGLVLGIGGFAAGGRPYGYRSGSWPPFFGWSGYGWPWDQNDSWDHSNDWSQNDDWDNNWNEEDFSGADNFQMPHSDLTEWRQGLTQVPLSEGFDHISLELGAAQCVILQGKALGVYTHSMNASVSGDTLRVTRPRRLSRARVLIILPEGFQAKHISIDAGASGVRIQSLICETFDLDAGAASVEIGSLQASGDISVETAAGALKIGQISCDEFDLDAGAASVQIDRLHAKDADFDIGVGSLDVGLLDSRDTALQCTGSASLTLAGAEEDYTITGEITFGSLQIGKPDNMRTVTGEGKTGDGARRMRADVSMGAVRLIFKG